MNNSTDPGVTPDTTKRERTRALLRRAGIIASWCFMLAGYVSVFHSVYARAVQLPVIAALLAEVWYVLPFSALLGALYGGEKKWMWALFSVVCSFVAMTCMILVLSWLRSTSMFH